MVCGMVGGCIAKLRVRRMSLFSVGKIGGGLVCSAMGVGPRIESTSAWARAGANSRLDSAARSRAHTAREQVRDRWRIVISLDLLDLDRAFLEIGLQGD